VAGNIFVTFQFWQDTVCQLFAQFYAPLVEGVDIEDHALSKDFVLVHRDQRTQAIRRDFTQQDGVGRTVTFEHFERCDVFNVFRFFTLIGEFFLDDVERFTEGQRFCLCKEVRQQFGVVIAQRVVADGRGDEVTRNDFGALMDQLIKRMLTIGARLAPDNRASLVIHRIAVTVNELTDSMLPCWKYAAKRCMYWSYGRIASVSVP